MAIDAISERVDRLEELMAELTSNVDRLTQEMREYKNASRQEIREYREGSQREIKEYREGSQREIREYRKESQREIREYREESRRGRAEMRQSIAEAYQKMGTLAEDLIAPSVPRILGEVVDCSEEPQMLGVRMRKRLSDGRSQEYDVVAVCDDYLLVNETKSRLRPEDVATFVEHLGQVRDFFPEYADKKVLGALATFYVDRSLVTYGERQGLIMLGVVAGLVEVLNSEEFVPKEY